jgi:hypothetical protein
MERSILLTQQAEEACINKAAGRAEESCRLVLVKLERYTAPDAIETPEGSIDLCPRESHGVDQQVLSAEVASRLNGRQNNSVRLAIRVLFLFFAVHN